ncbi:MULTISPECIES: YkuJ family protein [Brochothrix]|uniref:DUF1797 domain-containing protein n=1 Tax=Brochothrix thermosphacta TaxID=2756 RepID=A0A1D2KYE3_BROTH|nr:MULTISPECIES: YkuJ family protein [Brochothrix]SLM95472.1 hypothetical protein FM106_09585 [Brachybacterium faecium]ANZ94611.1 hypothetical protein BFC19_03965 [Brochothrix thermosphacta]ANZ97078.1 hypothetical protein BFC20_04755 [Brochothrix thermosphacta]ATF26502.1 DUF1797 domain-containing protein [Brochothrix thermosphacta]ATH85855.1 DUF1797 domain-containing protein [Brochothrix thermosphacta]
MSQLAGIIQRLNAMKEDDSVEVQQRRFEREGKAICEVKYYQATESFEIVILEEDQKYQFDNIDLAAIDIFELLQDAQ